MILIPQKPIDLFTSSNPVLTIGRTYETRGDNGDPVWTSIVVETDNPNLVIEVNGVMADEVHRKNFVSLCS